MIEVLLIEDDVADQVIFERHINSLNTVINLEKVQTLEAGVNACLNKKYHVIFCDYKLPDGTAQDFLANELVTEENTIIVLTAHVDFRLAVETVKMGAFDFIDKENVNELNLERLLSLAQRNQKEQELRAELESKLDENYGNTRAILDNSLDGIWLLSAQGEVQIINTIARSTIKEFFDISIKKGETLLELVPDNFRNNWKALFEKSLLGETGYSVMEFEMDNLSYVLETRTNPLGEKGNVSGVTFVVREISQRIRAEKRIRENERNFRSIFEGSEVPILLEDLETNIIVDLNSACAELHNYKVSEMIGMNIKETIPEHYFDISQQNYKLHLLGKLDVLDSLLVTSDKHEIPVQISVTEINFENKPTNLIFYQDISARKNTEKKLEEAKNLAEQTAIFKSQFLANMSHEIRTPLNALIGFTDLLLETNVNPVQKEYLELIEHSGSNLLHIINDILDLSKMEAGKLNIRNDVFNIHDLLERTLKLHEFKAKQKNIEIKLDIDSGLPKWILSDEVRLGQILNNLINNAVKFTNKGSVTIAANHSFDQNGNSHCLVNIIDSGIGVSKEEQERIFHKFTQVDGSFQRQHQGTGLGLAIVEQLVTLLKGQISVDSELNKGTTFKLDLPITISEAPAEQKNKTTDLKNYGSIKLLIVEDNDINLLLIEHILQKTDCEYKIAKNGQEGLELALSYKPDLILMDLQMPIMDGYEAATKILQKVQIPIYAMSAHVLEAERERCLNIGMIGFIPKPFKLHELLDVIKDNSKMKEKTEAKSHDEFWKLVKMPKLEELANDDLVFVDELFNIFIENIAKDLNEFKAANKSQDIKKIKGLVHKMSASFDTFNFNEILALGKKIEHTEFSNEDVTSYELEAEKSIHIVSDYKKLLDQ